MSAQPWDDALAAYEQARIVRNLPPATRRSLEAFSDALSDLFRLIPFIADIAASSCYPSSSGPGGDKVQTSPTDRGIRLVSDSKLDGYLKTTLRHRVDDLTRQLAAIVSQQLGLLHDGPTGESRRDDPTCDGNRLAVCRRGRGRGGADRKFCACGRRLEISHAQANSMDVST